jgi:hypothetical protein
MTRRTRQSTIGELRLELVVFKTRLTFVGQLRNTDPVHSKKMSLVIQLNIVAAQGLNGGADAFQARYLAGIDPLVLEELMQRLSGQLKG